MSDLGPRATLDLALIEMKVRGEESLDILLYAVGALAEAGAMAVRYGQDEIAEHVVESLAIVGARIRALRNPEDPDD